MMQGDFEKIDGIDVPRRKLFDLFSRTDDLLIALLKRLGQPETVNVGGQQMVVPSGGSQLIMVPPTRIFRDYMPPDASTTYYPTVPLADCREAVSVLIIIRSSCNQALTVQTIGAESGEVDASNACNIEASVSLAAGSKVALGIDLTTNWFPYMGCSIASGGTAPTSGVVNAYVFVRKMLR